MSVLTTKQRNKEPNSAFGLPKLRKFPLTNISHDEDAKGRARQAYNKGKITGAQLAEVDRKANKRIKGS